MNVRLVLLIGMTALFAALWSSDEQYQEKQMAAARAERQRLAIAAPVPAEKGIASIGQPAAVRTSPFDAFSWVAPRFAVPAVEGTLRSPVVAPLAVPSTLPVEGTASPMVTVVLSIQRPSFQFVGSFSGEDSKIAEGTDATPRFDADLAELSRFASRVRFEIDGQTCGLRWQMRRTAFFARRRFLRQLTRQWEWGELAEKIVLGALGQVAPPAKNAALPPVGEAR
jgi:hypothetical protein